MRKQRVVFVPEWIHRVIKREGLKLEDLLSFERIEAVFSRSDLANLTVMKDLAPKLIGNDKFQFDIACICEIWKSKLKQEQQKLFSVIDSIEGIHSKLAREETLVRIYGEQNQQISKNQNAIYESYLVGDSYIFVVVKTGFAIQDYSNACSELIRDLAKKHNVYEEYHELMSRPLGCAYVESLSR